MFWRNLLFILVLVLCIRMALLRVQRAIDEGNVPESPLEWFFYFERFWVAPWIFALTVFRGKPMASSRRLMLAMMAKLADADGIRQRSEIAILEDSLIRWYGEREENQAKAVQLLREIRDSGETLEDYTRQFASLFSWSLSMRANALDLLCSIAFADGVLHKGEDELLHSCALLLRIPRREEVRLRAQYGRFRYATGSEPAGSKKTSEKTSEKASESASEKSQAGASSNRKEQKRGSNEKNVKWAEILGCAANASFEDVRRSYRNLVMLYHPDRLKAHGLPEEQLHIVTARFLRIQEAYESARAHFEK